MLNLSMPALAAEASRLPAAGVGLMRAEFLALSTGTHPLAILEEGGAEAYITLFFDGLRQVADAFYPRPVTFRSTDLKSNEYRGLSGGERFEAEEANPMLGCRGAFRYLEQPDAFRLELAAVARVRSEGYDNVRLMLPFVRTRDELIRLRAMVDDGLVSSEHGPTELWAMAEVPAWAFLAEELAGEVDGVSIGSNDLTQLVLGVDRDSAPLGRAYGMGDPAVIRAIRCIIDGAHAAGRPVSICGDQPSRAPALVAMLVEAGVDAISVPPSAFETVRAHLEELVPRQPASPGTVRPAPSGARATAPAADG